MPGSLKATIDDLMDIWNTVRIPTAYQPNIVSKMKSVVEDYVLVKKINQRINRELLNPNRSKNAFSQKT